MSRLRRKDEAKRTDVLFQDVQHESCDMGSPLEESENKAMNIHPEILAEFRRDKPTGEPTWRDLLQAAGRVIDKLLDIVKERE